MTTVTDNPGTAMPGSPTHAHRRPPRWALPAAAGALGLCIGFIGGAQVAGPRPAPAPAASVAATAPASASPAAGYTPAPTDFDLAVAIKKQECFGTAGCAVTYQVAVTYNGLALDPGQTFEVTYSVDGLAQPAVNTFTVTGTDASVPKDETGQTEGPASLTATVTGVALAS